MFGPRNLNAKWLTSNFTDNGSGAGNFVTVAVAVNVAHGLPYTPSIDQIFAVITQANDGTSFDNGTVFNVVSIDATNIKIKPNRTLANSATPGLRSIQCRLLLLEDKENGSRIRLP